MNEKIVAELLNEYKSACSNVLPDYEASGLYSEDNRTLVKLSNLATLEEKFRVLTHARNKLAVSKGHKNYFEYITDWDGVSESRLETFLRSRKKLSSFHIDQLMHISKELDEFDSKSNHFNFYSFAIPKKVDAVALVNKFFKLDRKVNESVLKRINISHDISSSYFYSALSKNSANIFAPAGLDTPISAIILCHEYAHAIFQLSMLHKGISASKVKMFDQEAIAISEEFLFQKMYFPQNTHIYYLSLYDKFINTFFEKELYANPDSNLSKLFSESRKSLAPYLTEKENYSFLFDDFMVTMPCFSSTYSVLYFEKLFL